MKKIYVVALEWFDWDTEECERETEYYFFRHAEEALDFGHALSHSKSTYNSYGRPKDAYLYAFEDGDGGIIQDRCYHSAWLNLKEKTRY